MASQGVGLTTKSMEEFDQDLAKIKIRGQWHYDHLLQKAIGGPQPAGVPYIWKWETVHEKLLEACDVMQESLRARRNFNFLNPGLARDGTTQTLMMGMQIVKPGEVAWAHRHTIAALRFVIEGGKGLFTAVDGEVLPMETNDLVLTPKWTWHDHHNGSGRLGIWLDILDLPLVMALNQGFYQPFGETVQPLRDRNDDYVSERIRLVRPSWEQRPVENFPLRYPWRDVQEQLNRFAKSEGSPYDDILLEYVNPMTGGPAMPTMNCCIQLLRPGVETKPHRHTASAVYYVVEGEGTTIAGEEELEWSSHDAFALPNWTWHRHVNRSKSSNALLFSVTDQPLLTALCLYREEPEESFHRSPLPVIPAEKSLG